ncbi:hypothetical protein CBS101457_002867 [Exobasidium rhododendri]|nr:hypothetical protein CBS101457_002867 [Exobasidium rhododendri]
MPTDGASYDTGSTSSSAALGVGRPLERRPSAVRGSVGMTGGQGVSQANHIDDEALDNIRRYETFSTVDWIADSTRERARAARESTQKAQNLSSNSHLANGNGVSSAFQTDSAWGRARYGPGDKPPRWWPIRNPWGRRAWWFWRFMCRATGAVTDSGVVVLVGLLIGMNMAVISIATEWASDIKQGYCSAGWWLNQKFCCGGMEESGPGGAAVPPAAIVAAIAGAASSISSNTTSTSTSLSSTTTSVASKIIDTAAGPVITAAAQLGSRAVPYMTSAINQLYARAETSQGTPAGTADICEDWVSWSTWTLPSWIIYIFFAVVLSALCAHLVKVFAPYAAGSGISEIKCILAGFVINGYLGVWTFALKSLTLPLAISSGLSVGKEGPAVHIACCIGNIVGQLFRSFERSQARMRELLTAASAAGVAVAFGSPIGGVLFSLEEMAYNFPSSTMWRSFLCALAATVALSFMNPFRTGKLVLFQVSYDRDWHYFEIVFYVIIGIFGGLYGAFVIRYNLQVQKFRRENLASHGVAEAAVLAGITAFIGYWNMFLRIDMTESLEILFRECEGGGDYDNLCQSSTQWQMINSLLLATVLRVVFVILSYGCKVPAGIFVPSMAVGATFGRMVGILVKALYNAYPHAAFFSACQPDVPCITPGTYAFLGAAAALAGVTRITVAVVVIMFELTGALTYILPTMLVVMITKGVGDWFGKGGISEQTIKFQGYPFLDKDDHIFNLTVGNVMTRDVVVLFANGMELQEVESRLAAGIYKGFPIVAGENDMTLLGYAGKTEVRYAIGKARRVRSSLSPKMICYFTLDGHAARGLPPTPLLNTFDDAQEARRQRQQANEDDERQGLMNKTLLGGDDDVEEEVQDEDDALEGGDDELLGNAGGGVDGEGEEDTLELGGWVEANPLHVQPTMPLEVVMDLFKKMGPRVILVSKFGKLEGMVTVKDLLKVIATQERAELLAHEAARDARSSQPGSSLPTNATNAQRLNSMRGMRAASLHEFGVGDFGGELEILLKDAWQWTKVRTDRIGVSLRPFSGRFQRRTAGDANPRRNMAATEMSARGEADAGETSYFVLEEEETEEDITGNRAERSAETISK